VERQTAAAMEGQLDQEVGSQSPTGGEPSQGREKMPTAVVAPARR
jgi:hypothetical protein